MVLERIAVAVAVVGLGATDAVLVLGVLHERDGRGVGAERGARQGQTSHGRFERLTEPVTPGQGLATVVDLVQDDERAGRLGPGPVQHGLRRHLGVRHRDADEPLAVPAVRVLEVRVDRQADPGCGVGPLPLQVIGGRHDADAIHDAGIHQGGRHPEGEGRLTGARRGDCEEVPRPGAEVLVQSLLLPGTQFGRGAPGGTLRVGRWEGGAAEERVSHGEKSLARVVGRQRKKQWRAVGNAGARRHPAGPSGNPRAGRGRAGATWRRRCPCPDGGPRRSPCTWGTRGTSAGHGPGSRPCRRAR
ncbi:hypothetical protein QFZ52_001923 [Arthrobacter woluwensis]|nr:hypothetical protein [Arthrobacter woluwensis]